MKVVGKDSRTGWFCKDAKMMVALQTRSASLEYCIVSLKFSGSRRLGERRILQKR